MKRTLQNYKLNAPIQGTDISCRCFITKNKGKDSILYPEVITVTVEYLNE